MDPKVKLILLSTIISIVTFFLSTIGVINADWSTLDYIRDQWINILDSNHTLLDLLSLFLGNTIFNLLVITVMRSYISVRKSDITRALLTVETIAVNALVLLKFILVVRYGTDAFPVLSFFVWIYLVLGLGLSAMQLYIVAQIYQSWINGFEYVQVAQLDPEQETTPPVPRVSWSRLFGLLKPDAWLLAIGMTALAVNSITSLVYLSYCIHHQAVPYFFGRVVDIVSSVDGSPQDLTDIVGMLFVVFIVGGVTGFIRAYAFTLQGYLIVKRLRCEVFRAIVLQVFYLYAFL